MTFLRVIGFSVAVLLAYTLFANILPQVQGDPPNEEEIDTGSLNMAGMIGFGERLFSGKGSCTLCHNDLGRAPDMLNADLALSFAERLNDELYQGEAKQLQGGEAVGAYIRESMLDPSKYVVAGFGKKGSSDKVSPMPKANTAPLNLSDIEINAVIAFLQDKAGIEPTIELPSLEAASVVTNDEDEEEGEEPAQTATEALDKFTCSGCHDLEGSEADVGPKLNGIGARMDRSELIAAIIDPNAQIAEGFEADTMPDDLAEQMRVSELNLIVEYLEKLPE